jgi:hypothetical protein
MENRKTSPKYSSEVRERAVRMVFNHAGDYPTQGRLKWSSQHSEVIWWRGPWRSMEAVEFATLEWVDWFNNRRLLNPVQFTISTIDVPTRWPNIPVEAACEVEP